MITDYLASAKKQFAYYKSLGEKTFAQLQDEQLFWKYNPESNSVATIVKHLTGNMLSRWTDFLTSDGEKEERKRDDEFENDIKDREQLMMVWNEGWQCLFFALDSLDAADLLKKITIRQEPYSAMDAINRQLAHYAYHVGQIVYIGKMACNDDWTSLTIPRGKSKEFNSAKIAEAKSK
jgi:hypothetical protein